MRVQSIHSMRGRGAGAQLVQDLPAEGSKIRLIYDLFFEYRGSQIPDPEWEALLAQVGNKKIRRHCNSLLRTYMADLQDYWGCDFRRLPGQRRVALVGEWTGKVYLDYTREAREQACQDD